MWTSSYVWFASIPTGVQWMKMCSQLRLWRKGKLWTRTSRTSLSKFTDSFCRCQNWKTASVYYKCLQIFRYKEETKYTQRQRNSIKTRLNVFTCSRCTATARAVMAVWAVMITCWAWRLQVRVTAMGHVSVKRKKMGDKPNRWVTWHNERRISVPVVKA